MKWNTIPDSERTSIGLFDNSKVGPAPQFQKLTSIQQSFEVFMSDVILSEIQKCTNIFGQNRYDIWKPVSSNELKAFIGILIAAGRCKENHMSVDLMWTNKMPGR